MNKVIDIVAIEEILGYTLILQEYETDYYLRVEDDGNAVLKVGLSIQGEILDSDKWKINNEKHFKWVLWAQNLIEKNRKK